MVMLPPLALGLMGWALILWLLYLMVTSVTGQPAKEPAHRKDFTVEPYDYEADGL